MAEESDRAWDKVASRSYAFASLPEECAALRALTLTQVRFRGPGRAGGVHCWHCMAADSTCRRLPLHPPLISQPTGPRLLRPAPGAQLPLAPQAVDPHRGARARGRGGRAGAPQRRAGR